jgi:hypothetical protein
LSRWLQNKRKKRKKKDLVFLLPAECIKAYQSHSETREAAARVGTFAFGCAIAGLISGCACASGQVNASDADAWLYALVVYAFLACGSVACGIFIHAARL